MVPSCPRVDRFRTGLVGSPAKKAGVGRRRQNREMALAIPERSLLISDFVADCIAAGLRVPLSPIRHEVQLAPHEPHPLRPGCCAIYVFSLGSRHGKRCSAGVDRVLKVGKAGATRDSSRSTTTPGPRAATWRPRCSPPRRAGPTWGLLTLLLKAQVLGFGRTSIGTTSMLRPRMSSC